MPYGVKPLPELLAIEVKLSGRLTIEDLRLVASEVLFLATQTGLRRALADRWRAIRNRVICCPRWNPARARPPAHDSSAARDCSGCSTPLSRVARSAPARWNAACPDACGTGRSV